MVPRRRADATGGVARCSGWGPHAAYRPMGYRIVDPGCARLPTSVEGATESEYAAERMAWTSIALAGSSVAFAPSTGAPDPVRQPAVAAVMVRTLEAPDRGKWRLVDGD